MAYDQKTGAHQIGVRELADLLAAEGGAVMLLDVRLSEERRVSTLPGSKHVPPKGPPKHGMELDLDGVDEDALRSAGTVVAFCTAGLRSGFAATTLEERIGRRVLSLHGA